MKIFDIWPIFAMSGRKDPEGDPPNPKYDSSKVRETTETDESESQGQAIPPSEAQQAAGLSHQVQDDLRGRHPIPTMISVPLALAGPGRMPRPLVLPPSSPSTSGRQAHEEARVTSIRSESLVRHVIYEVVDSATHAPQLHDDQDQVMDEAQLEADLRVKRPALGDHGPEGRE